MAEKRHTLCWLGMLVRCALLAGLLFQAAMLLLRLFQDITYPYPLDYGEGIALDRALVWARGAPLYLPMDRPPYASWNFPPLYAWICGLGARWLGPGFAVGRAVSALATGVTACCVYLLARRHLAGSGGGRPERWAILAPLLYLGGEAVTTWGALIRVDSLGVALGLAGYTAVAGGASPVLAAVLFAMALLCKQSMVAGLAAACLGLAAARRWRDAALLLSTFALIVGAVFTWQQIATHGWFLWHVVTCQAHHWKLAQLWGVAGPVVKADRVLLALAVVGLFGGGAPEARPEALREGARVPIPTPGRYYFLGAVAVALLAGKVGSHANYLLDLAAAAAVLGASTAARLEAALDRRAGGGAGMAAASALLYIHAWGNFSYPPIDTRLPLGAASGVVVRALARAPGPVIAEDPGLVPATGKPLWIQPFEFTQMAELGTWDQKPLVAALRRAEFGAIVLRFDPWEPSHREADGTWGHGRFTDEMVAAMRSSYRIDRRVYCWAILRPRDEGRGAGYESGRALTARGRRL